MPLDARARSIFQYFKNYNYDVAGTGEVIRFVGNYRASKGQAAALVLYTFLGAHLPKYGTWACFVPSRIVFGCLSLKP